MSSFNNGKFATIQTFGKDIRKEISLDNIPIVYDAPLWYRLIENDICLDIFLHLRRQKRTYIFGQDALVEGRSNLPYFYRVKWLNDFTDGSFITFNDPTLYLDRSLKGGWWQLEGSLQLAAKFITNLLINLDVTHEHTIFYGASAGGYFSLACAGLFPKSKIVGDISQVDLPSSPYDYNVPLLQQFGINNFKDIFYYWDINQLPSNIYILMNKGDTSHISSQLTYFLDHLNTKYHSKGQMIQNLTILRYENNDKTLRGHSPWQKDSLIDFLKRL
jgi:hypothetical protein